MDPHKKKSSRDWKYANIDLNWSQPQHKELSNVVQISIKTTQRKIPPQREIVIGGEKLATNMRDKRERTRLIDGEEKTRE